MTLSPMTLSPMTDASTDPSQSDMDLILASFELAGERAGDIAPAVYEHYFARCPESRELMVLVDKYMRGRMLERVLQLLMADTLDDERSYLRFETRMHVAYGVQTRMYDNLLLGVRDAVRDALGGDWNAAYEAAWTRHLQPARSLAYRKTGSDLCAWPAWHGRGCSWFRVGPGC